jgi:hypothetical protein
MAPHGYPFGIGIETSWAAIQKIGLMDAITGVLLNRLSSV